MIVCKNCGWSYSGGYCPKCGTEYMDESEDGLSDVTISSPISKETREAEARYELWQAMHDTGINKSRCVSCAKELKKFSPEDYYAEFALVACIGTDKELSQFLDKSSSLDTRIYADAVLDFICVFMSENLYASVRAYKNRSYLKDSSEYEEIIEKYVPETIRREREKAERKRLEHEANVKAKEESRAQCDRLKEERKNAANALKRKKYLARERKKKERKGRKLLKPFEKEVRKRWTVEAREEKKLQSEKKSEERAERERLIAPERAERKSRAVEARKEKKLQSGKKREERAEQKRLRAVERAKRRNRAVETHEEKKLQSEKRREEQKRLRAAKRAERKNRAVEVRKKKKLRKEVRHKERAGRRNLKANKKAERAKIRKSNRGKKNSNYAAFVSQHEKALTIRVPTIALATAFCVLIVFSIISADARHWCLSGMILLAVLYANGMVKYHSPNAWNLYAAIAQVLLFMSGMLITLIGTFIASTYALMLSVALFAVCLMYIIGGDGNKVVGAGFTFASVAYVVTNLLICIGVTSHCEIWFSVLSLSIYATLYVTSFLSLHKYSPDENYGMCLMPNMLMSLSIPIYMLMLTPDLHETVHDKCFLYGFWPDQHVLGWLFAVFLFVDAIVDFVKWWSYRDDCSYGEVIIKVRICYTIFEVAAFFMMMIVLIS